MTPPAFFGYGSLVNLATHAFAAPRPATLQGWRRVWQGTSLRDAAFLSVTQDPNCTLQGIVAEVPNADWVALDKREAAYRRHDVSDMITCDPVPHDTAIYQVDQTCQAAPDNHPILLSYLDVVIQGYLQVFGPDGATHFFATTSHWDRPILNDRADPLYPRHQQLTDAELTIVDRHLATVMK